MSNGICKIKLKEGKEISFLFGMKAVIIFSEKYAKELQRLQTSDPKNIDDFKSFCYVVYGGLCNYAELKELEYPTFEDAYLLSEEINYDSDMVKKIFDAFNDSRASKELLKRLSPESIDKSKKKA